jgi:hypothetical protein
MIINYDRNHRLIVLAPINMIISYARKAFIVQATGTGTPISQHFLNLSYSQGSLIVGKPRNLRPMLPPGACTIKLFTDIIYGFL